MKMKKGFTIVELLIVIVVIAILAVISVAVYNGVQQRARDSVRKNDATTIAKSLRLWSYGANTQFQSMNAGNSSPANGWFDAGYSSTPSVRTVLETSGYLSAKDIDDPLRGSAGANRWRYMIAPCTNDPNDNRRVVLIELEIPTSQTVLEQLSSAGCDSTFLSSYSTTYRVNYAMLADAR